MWAVVKLGVMDAPGLSLGTPILVSKLAQHTGCNHEYLYCLMRYVSQFGMLREEPGQQFRLTTMGQLLQAANPSGMCYAAVSVGDPGPYVPWLHLHKVVKEGEDFCSDCKVLRRAPAATANST